jgi:hypothetical protein
MHVVAEPVLSFIFTPRTREDDLYALDHTNAQVPDGTPTLLTPSASLHYAHELSTYIRETNKGKFGLQAGEMPIVTPKGYLRARMDFVPRWAEKPLAGSLNGSLYVPDVTAELACALRRHVPGETDLAAACRRALAYLKLTAARDPRSGYWLFHQEAAALCRGNSRLAERGMAGVTEILDALAERVGLVRAEAVPGRSCTQVIALELPRGLQDTFDTEIGRRARRALCAQQEKAQQGEPCVFVDPGTGEPTASSLVKPRSKVVKQAKESILEDAPEEVVAFMDKLNGLRKTRFTRRLNDAEKTLYALARERYTGRGYIGIERLIRAACAVRAPVYKMTSRTLRLSPACQSAYGLPKAMRRTVFAKALEVDMASAQLALAAALWDVPELRDFLRAAREEGSSWWGELIGYLRTEFPANVYEPDDYGLVKAPLKGGTYGIMYTMAKKNLRRFGNPDTMQTKELEEYETMTAELERIFQAPLEAIGEAFLAHPLVQPLLKRRNNMLRFIRNHQGITDCFGRWLSTEDPGSQDGRRGAASVLAEWMQNAELFVMLHVGRAALEDSELYFLLWQHDGITVVPRRQNRPSAYASAVERMETALGEGLQALQRRVGCPEIITWLTVDYAPEIAKL